MVFEPALDDLVTDGDRLPGDNLLDLMEEEDLVDPDDILVLDDLPLLPVVALDPDFSNGLLDTMITSGVLDF